MKKIKAYENILEAIGQTPLVKINKLNETNCSIFAKIESFNPCSSIKDRIALSMINDAEEKGLLKKGSTIIEPTSGNTGIGLAYICAVKGYRLILTMPSNMSIERQKILKILGSELVLTSKKKGMTGAIEEVKKLLAKEKNAITLDQFSNSANPKAHRETTAKEIWEQLDGKIDVLVCGIGTGGTITGCGEYLKNLNKDLYVVGIEPKSSPAISKGITGPHKIEGIGAGFIPSILNREIIDEIILISDEKALEAAQNLAKKEGILSGISSGAALCGALEIARRFENKNKNIVVVFPDTGERYITTDMYEGL